MKRLGLIAMFVLAIALVAQQQSKSSRAKQAAPKHEFAPNEMQWGPPPPFLPPGAQVAVLEGNPAGSSGDYTIRAKMPDGYVIGPHFHPKRENVTIVSGNLKFGMGDKFDESKMKTYGGGAFFYMDPAMHHYVKAQGETVVQVHGQAPLAFTYLNPKDDPRKK